LDLQGRGGGMIGVVHENAVGSHGGAVVFAGQRNMILGELGGLGPVVSQFARRRC
jgi:hypothetical protein